MVLPIEEKAHIISGDEAVAQAVADAGVRLAASYPGTPATDILEHLQRMKLSKLFAASGR